MAFSKLSRLTPFPMQIRGNTSYPFEILSQYGDKTCTHELWSWKKSARDQLPGYPPATSVQLTSAAAPMKY